MSAEVETPLWQQVARLFHKHGQVCPWRLRDDLVGLIWDAQKAAAPDQSGSAGTDAAPPASEGSRESPSLPSREELERALRETLPFLRMQAHDAMTPEPLRSLIAQISALTSKEPDNG